MTLCQNVQCLSVHNCSDAHIHYQTHQELAYFQESTALDRLYRRLDVGQRR